KAATAPVKEGVMGFLEGVVDTAKNLISDEVSEWEKPEKEKEGSEGPIEGGLSFGLLKLEIEKEGVEAEDVSEYWSPTDIAGPIVVAQFCNLEGQFGGSKGKYTGIDSVEFMDGGSMVGRLVFPTIGNVKTDQTIGVGLKVEFTPVAMAGGIAQKEGS
ncbi:MAG TPA: hypothetical protein VGS21_05030, partial [Acidimicrobiales bacterium]|nr:hypothetical protein [Acidimicrobiales bacterium]